MNNTDNTAENTAAAELAAERRAPSELAAIEDVPAGLILGQTTANWSGSSTPVYVETATTAGYIGRVYAVPPWCSPSDREEFGAELLATGETVSGSSRTAALAALAERYAAHRAAQRQAAAAATYGAALAGAETAAGRELTEAERGELAAVVDHDSAPGPAASELAAAERGARARWQAAQGTPGERAALTAWEAAQAAADKAAGLPPQGQDPNAAAAWVRLEAAERAEAKRAALRSQR